MMKNLTFLFVFLCSYIVVKAEKPGAYYIYERYGAGDAYQVLCSGKYVEAWNRSVRHVPYSNQSVRALVQARILGDQGAYYLAANLWTNLKNEIIALDDDYLSLEYYLLGAD